MTTDEKFQYCMTIILEHEGGLSDDVRDKGGVTQWGISLRFLRTIGVDINGDGDIDADDIHAITKPNAIQIYHKYWWEKYSYQRFFNVEIVSKTFDLAVNMGAIPAHKILQKACNTFMKTQLVVDGILGTQTLLSANTLNSTTLRQALRDCAKDRYMEIIAANPAMECWKNGWLNRAAW